MQHKIYCDSEPDAKKLRNALDKCRGVTCDRVGEHVYTNANRFMCNMVIDRLEIIARITEI